MPFDLRVCFLSRRKISRNGHARTWLDGFGGCLRCDCHSRDRCGGLIYIEGVVGIFYLLCRCWLEDGVSYPVVSVLRRPLFLSSFGPKPSQQNGPSPPAKAPYFPFRDRLNYSPTHPSTPKACASSISRSRPGGTRFPRPSTGTYRPKPGPTGDKNLLVIPTPNLRFDRFTKSGQRHGNGPKGTSDCSNLTPTRLII
jgi:hypothetical protein